MVIHRRIFENNQITLSPCFNFTPKTGVSFYCESVKESALEISPQVLVLKLVILFQQPTGTDFLTDLLILSIVPLSPAEIDSRRSNNQLIKHSLLMNAVGRFRPLGGMTDSLGQKVLPSWVEFNRRIW